MYKEHDRLPDPILGRSFDWQKTDFRIYIGRMGSLPQKPDASDVRAVASMGVDGVVLKKFVDGWVNNEDVLGAIIKEYPKTVFMAASGVNEKRRTPAANGATREWPLPRPDCRGSPMVYEE